MATTKDLRFSVTGTQQVSAQLLMPANPKQLLVLAHGAGAGMDHPFMEKLANNLATAGVATFRYQFPYMEEQRKIPDKPPTLTATVATAVRTARELAPMLPLFAGGKSLGGRMTSQAAAQDLLENVKGLIFFGFPLHPPNQPGIKRADHLAQVKIPMLFLQGTRDAFADLKLLCPLCAKLAPRATLHVIETADHSFHVLKSSPRTDREVLQDLAQTVATWAQQVVGDGIG
jgi:uncharacterized protein